MSNIDTNNKEMLENAVFQQLFLGGKRIMGKNPENTMQLTGVGDLLDYFIEDLYLNLHFLADLDVHSFLAEFENIFSYNLSETESRIKLLAFCISIPINSPLSLNSAVIIGFISKLPASFPSDIT